MSGIYGLYRYDGAPVDPRWLEQMKSAMAYYGPHGESSKIEGPVGMGHLLLEISPEDAFENQPVRGERGLVASDARLDNRAELLETFHVSAAEASHLSDGHLVSLAFDRWGEEVCSHLQGDWSLAAWDPRERRLLLALNACGNATIYFYEGKGFMAFASSLKALLALPGVTREPNLLRLAQVLVSWWPDGDITAYKGFQRLAWAHAMTADHDGRIRNWRHWSAEGREPLSYRRNEEYEEEFLELYTRAVQGCLRTRKPVAMELSGGRDSGSVAALAGPLLASQGRELTAYTSVPYLPTDGAGPGRIGNEWELAHATATMAGPNVRHVPIDARDYEVIKGIEYLLDIHDGPSHAAINNYWVQAVMEASERDGAAVVLNGSMGNATVSWPGNGSALLTLVQGNPSTALRLFLSAEPNAWLTLKRQVLKPLLSPGLRALRRMNAPHGRSWQAYSALNLKAALDLDMDGRMRAAGYDDTMTQSPLLDCHPIFFSIWGGIGTGLGAESGAWHRLAYLDPTANLSLVEFFLRVPEHQFRRRENGSWLFRRTFRNRMPESVINSRCKGLQAADAGHRIVGEIHQFRECLDSLDALPEVRDILDIPLLRRCLEDLTVKIDPDTTATAGSILLRGLGVGLFIRRLVNSET